MMKTLLKHAMVATVAAAAMLGVASQAQAATAAEPAAVVQQVTAVDIAPSAFEPMVSKTFTRAQTEEIYHAAVYGGAAAVMILCTRYGVIGCDVVVGIIMSKIPHDPPAGRCIKVGTQWRPPFYYVKYVNCVA